MKRRTFLQSIGALSVLGCSTIKADEKHEKKSRVPTPCVWALCNREKYPGAFRFKITHHTDTRTTAELELSHWESVEITSVYIQYDELDELGVRDSRSITVRHAPNTLAVEPKRKLIIVIYHPNKRKPRVISAANCTGDLYRNTK